MAGYMLHVSVRMKGHSMSLAEKLLKLRQDKGQSLQAVADAVGASRAHIWEVETGRTKNPSLDFVRRLADHYGVSVGWLVGEMVEGNADQEAAVLYRTFRSLSPQNRQHLQAIIDSMRKAGA